MLSIAFIIIIGICTAPVKASPLYDNVGWFDLPDEARLALRVLGYNGYRWDNCQEVWSSTAWWSDMSSTERQAAQVLGWTGESWDNHDADDHYCNRTGEPRGEGPDSNPDNSDGGGDTGAPTFAPEVESESEEPELTPSPTEAPERETEPEPEPTPRPAKNNNEDDDDDNDDNSKDDDQVADNSDTDDTTGDDTGGGDGTGDSAADDDDPGDLNVPPMVRNQICQSSSNSLPHMAGRWRDGFPNDSTPTALCNNRISLEENGDLCVEGRATFQQLVDFLDGGTMYATSSSSVSINGLMMSGQGNLALAGDWRYIYDFVNSYTVNGERFLFTNTQDLMDNIFLASRGTIDGFCLDSSIMEGPPAFRLVIEPNIPFDLQADAGDVQEATIVYISAYLLTIETHIAEDDSSLAREPVINVEGLLDDISNFLFGEDGGDNLNMPNDPSFIEDLSGTAASFGLLRYIQNQGVYSTRTLINGIYEGDDNWFTNEQIQMDTQWSVFVDMVDSGWFNDNPPPTFDLILAVRHIRANGSSRGCWKEDTAAIAIGSPVRAVDDNESYAAKVLEGIESFGGKISLHYGKRSPRNVGIRRAALRTYEECGIEMDVDPVRCVHPSCRRTEVIEPFEWPAEYYDV